MSGREDLSYLHICRPVSDPYRDQLAEVAAASAAVVNRYLTDHGLSLVANPILNPEAVFVDTITNLEAGTEFESSTASLSDLDAALEEYVRSTEPDRLSMSIAGVVWRKRTQTPTAAFCPNGAVHPVILKGAQRVNQALGAVGFARVRASSPKGVRLVAVPGGGILCQTHSGQTHREAITSIVGRQVERTGIAGRIALGKTVIGIYTHNHRLLSYYGQ